MIKPPLNDPKRNAIRAVVEAFAQLTPLTTFLSRIYQTTHPSKTDGDRQRWEVEITNELNRLLAQKTVGSTERVFAWGAINFSTGAHPIDDGHNISSVTDCGIGELFIALCATPDEDYHISVEPNGGDIEILEKSSTGFRVKIQKYGMPIDLPFKFVAIARINFAYSTKPRRSLEIA